MFQPFAIVGPLKALALEFKGTSSFPVLTMSVSIGEKFFDLETKGQDALRINGVIGDAPAGTPVKAIGYINQEKGKDGRVWQRFIVTSVGPDFSGRQSAVASITGRVLGVVDAPKKDGGSFKKPMLGIVGADRDGLVTDGGLELSFSKSDSDRLISEWEANVGALAEVEVDLTAWISEKQRSFPRYNAKSVKFNAWPSYITAFDPMSEAAVDFGTTADSLNAAV